MALRARDAPWLVVLGLISVFHVIRGAWVELVVFVLALICALGGRRRLHVKPQRGRLRLLVAAVMCGLVLLIAPRHGIIAGLITGCIGVYAFVLAIGSEPPRAPESGTGERRALRRAMIAWSGVIILAGVWEATAYLTWRWGLCLPASCPRYPIWSTRCSTPQPARRSSCSSGSPLVLPLPTGSCQPADGPTKCMPSPWPSTESAC